MYSFFRLIPNDDLEDSHSSKSDGDGSDQEEGIGLAGREAKMHQVEDDELGDGLKVTLSSDGSLDTNDSFNSHRHHPLNHQDAIGGFMGLNSMDTSGLGGGGGGCNSAPVTIGASTDLLTPNAAATRRRRKLPEIPKNKKCKWKLKNCITRSPHYPACMM